MSPEELLRMVEALEWTEERRPEHPWFTNILIRKSDVEDLIRLAIDEDRRSY